MIEGIFQKKYKTGLLFLVISLHTANKRIQIVMALQNNCKTLLY